MRNKKKVFLKFTSPWERNGKYLPGDVLVHCIREVGPENKFPYYNVYVVNSRCKSNEEAYYSTRFTWTGEDTLRHWCGCSAPYETHHFPTSKADLKGHWLSECPLELRQIIKGVDFDYLRFTMGLHYINFPNDAFVL